MNVYLVVEWLPGAAGSIFAVFADRADAEWFAEQLNDETVQVEERTLWYGQPPVRGFNK